MLQPHIQPKGEDFPKEADFLCPLKHSYQNTNESEIHYKFRWKLSHKMRDNSFVVFQQNLNSPI
jgi:hypothetical protein